MPSGCKIRDNRLISHQAGNPGALRHPLLTVITPTLDRRRYIEQALASVRGQTYPAIEHVVVDGGSTDGTLEVLNRYAAEGSILFTSGPDDGMYDAINKGLAQARGDVIGYLNSDDVYFPWTAEVVMEAFRVWPNADVVFGDGLAVDHRRSRQRLAFIPPFDVRHLAVSGSLFQPAVFVRRRVFEANGLFDPKLRFVGDLEYWVRIGKDAEFRRIDEVLAAERIHDLALSTAHAGSMAREERAVRARFGRGTRLSLGIARIVARARAGVWRRRLFARFLAAMIRGSGASSSWRMFRTHGSVRIDPARAALAQIPRFGAGFAWNAIRSGRNWFGDEFEC
jgi:glycosyltransferase involved in cell wall biosynthesis